MTVKYIGYYDTDDNKKENRNIVLAATNKMSYIISAIEKSGHSVEVISASGTNSKKYCHGKKVDISEKSTLKLFSALPNGNKIQRIFRQIYLTVIFFFYLLFNLKKDDTVIVYHSLGYMRTVSFLKKIKKFRFILETEEIYGDVIGNTKVSKKELKFFSLADSYIFPTELLDEKVNESNKPSVIIYGTYKVEKAFSKIFNDDKIHCVYAGTFDPRKGGAFSAVKCSEYLNEQYVMHIIGFGTETDKQDILQLIDEISKTTKCKISYDGLLSGDNYLQFIQSCDIGLSTQKPQGKYNETSFPSKILSYLSNGVHVVSVKIRVVEKSVVSSLINYYDENTPQAIADAIKGIEINNDYDSKKIIEELNQRFIKDIQSIL